MVVIPSSRQGIPILGCLTAICFLGAGRRGYSGESEVVVDGDVEPVLRCCRGSG